MFTRFCPGLWMQDFNLLIVYQFTSISLLIADAVCFFIVASFGPFLSFEWRRKLTFCHVGLRVSTAFNTQHHNLLSCDACPTCPFECSIFSYIHACNSLKCLVFAPFHHCAEVCLSCSADWNQIGKVFLQSLRFFFLYCCAWLSCSSWCSIDVDSWCSLIASCFAAVYRNRSLSLMVSPSPRLVSSCCWLFSSIAVSI